MLPQFDNLVMSSVYLFLDNIILSSGQAYTNVTTRFYPTNSEFNGLYAYSAPYSQIVSDFSINGANILTGVYVGSTLYSTGSGNLSQINYDRGAAYFSVNPTQTVSGSYAIKDFNIQLTTEPEETLITETKYVARQKIPISPTGVAYNEVTYPVLYIKNNGSTNEPVAFGGLDSTDFNVRLVALSDSQFKLDAVTSIIRDQQKKPIALFSASDMPFNAFGGYKTTNYNYTGIAYPKIRNNQFLFIDRVYVSKYTESVKADIKTLNSQVFVAFVDMEISNYRHPR